MGYAMCIAPCLLCKRPFAFNPNKVPSIRHNGEKQPVCEACVKMANHIRAERGLPLWTVQPDAYEPINEEEL